MTEMFSLFHQASGSVLYECEIDPEFATASTSVKRGIAVKKAVAESVHLDGANLNGANLNGANLNGANLNGANLDGASFVGAKIRNDIIIHRTPLQIAGQEWPVLIFDDHMKIGCELHSLADWRAFSDRRIALMDGASAIRFWHANGLALLAFAAADGRGLPKKDDVTSET